MILLNNVSKSFGERVIFEDTTLQIEKEKITAIVGGSGAGKTTLLNMIGLLDLDYKGDITVAGTTLRTLGFNQRAKFIRKNINYLFQDYALIESETVEYNLLLSLEYLKMDKKDKQVLINQALSKVGLEDFNHKKVYTLSGGEQQRIALARVIIKPSKLILTDEPTGNLDEDNGRIVFDLLKELKDEGKTIVVVTHNLDLAKECDNIIYINKLL